MAGKQTILVTGSNGQLGSELKELASLYPDFEFAFLTRDELPLGIISTIANTITAYNPQYVINCAAYTAVDKAESEREETFKVNAESVGEMARICAEIGAKFIHISTDYVFDGNRKSPLKEDDSVSPINVYGESKLAGEEAALKNNPHTIIIRTSWVYSFYGKNFVKTMMRLMAEKDSISVVNDQWGSPTYAADLAKAILKIIESGNGHSGIFHFSNDGIITWFEFAKEIGAQLQTSCTIQPTTTANFPTPAKRPFYSVMDKSKISQLYSITPRPWKESLQECLQKLKSNIGFH
ncbi:MAG: dTDP-4-dehydrorhamnose reductase [Chitinophagaceae bacterium]|nr:MAG: dTDP-4-dehydrorhamnose reductase [Chitinophagaceae bacterium]